MIFVVDNASAFVVGSVPAKDAKDIFSPVAYNVLLGTTTTTSLMMGRECGALPTDGCVVTGNTTFQPGVFDLPNGIRIEASNLTLDCNGALFEGQDYYYTAISLYVQEGVTIKNCEFYNYYSPLRLNSASNLRIVNNQFRSDPWIGGTAIDIYSVSASSFEQNSISSGRSRSVGFWGNSHSNFFYQNYFGDYFGYYVYNASYNVYEENTFFGYYSFQPEGDYNAIINNDFFVPMTFTGNFQNITGNQFFEYVSDIGFGSYIYDNDLYDSLFEDRYEEKIYCYDGKENRYHGFSGPDCNSDYYPDLSGINATYITSISARVVWDTDRYSTSTVYYATNPSDLNQSVSDSLYVTSHKIDLRNLTGDTTYYFKVSSCTILECSNSSLMNFTTPVYPYCDDGTPFGRCTANPPFYCDEGEGEIVSRCDLCGCNDGGSCQYGGPLNGTCVSVNYGYLARVCGDGTLYGNCSATKPLFCDDGELIPKCQQCGCPKDDVCRESGKGAGSCLEVNYGYAYLPSDSE